MIHPSACIRLKQQILQYSEKSKDMGYQSKTLNQFMHRKKPKQTKKKERKRTALLLHIVHFVLNPNVFLLRSYYFYRLFGAESKNKLPLGEFLQAVGQLKFRGTSVLFRLQHSSTTSLKL